VTIRALGSNVDIYTSVETAPRSQNGECCGASIVIRMLNPAMALWRRSLQHQPDEIAGATCHQTCGVRKQRAERIRPGFGPALERPGGSRYHPVHIVDRRSGGRCRDLSGHRVLALGRRSILGVDFSVNAI
jgi:hypothetical protein